ncbi:MAG TPA: penicillin-binding protein, partial [Ruminococcaceae bacterium]|nr:penicillin-binding protein [Oscillospiraceae bacterium]
MEENEPSNNGFCRYLFAGFIIFAAFAACVYRLVDWQIINGSKFLELSNHTSVVTISMDAARGEILDSDGNGLAVNKTGYALVFNKIYMDSGSENKTIIGLIRLLDKRGEKWEDTLPIEINEKGGYQFKSGEEKEIKKLKSKDFLDVNSYATAAECMKYLADQYDCNGYSAKDTRDIVSVRYNMTKDGFSNSTPYTFAEDVDKDTVLIVSENSNKLQGISVKITTKRLYPDGTLLPHILGTIGA